MDSLHRKNFVFKHNTKMQNTTKAIWLQSQNEIVPPTQCEIKTTIFQCLSIHLLKSI